MSLICLDKSTDGLMAQLHNLMFPGGGGASSGAKVNVAQVQSNTHTHTQINKTNELVIMWCWDTFWGFYFGRLGAVT